MQQLIQNCYQEPVSEHSLKTRGFFWMHASSKTRCTFIPVTSDQNTRNSEFWAAASAQIEQLVLKHLCTTSSVKRPLLYLQMTKWLVHKHEYIHQCVLQRNLVPLRQSQWEQDVQSEAPQSNRVTAHQLNARLQRSQTLIYLWRHDTVSTMTATHWGGNLIYPFILNSVRNYRHRGT